MRRLISLILVVTTLATLSGCFRRKGQDQAANPNVTTLVFYGLYDSSEIWDPFIRAYETSHPNVQIEYKRFNNEAEYWSLIVNELAEGEGPDIFLMNNGWIPFQTKKLTPAPSAWADPKTFRDLYVEVAQNDWIRPDAQGVEQVWGMPVGVDTLGLYYNKDQFEESLPETGKPAKTWGEWAQDIPELNRENGKKLERGAIALGRVDNINRGLDSIWLWLLQSGAFSKVEGAWTLETGVSDEQNLNLWRSYADPKSTLQSWDLNLANPESSEKELTAFAQGKVSSILGYSHTYSQILAEISRLKSLRQPSIDPLSIGTATIPQIQDPKIENGQPKTIASYYAPVVSRTTTHADIAWDFLLTLATSENMQAMHQLSHRPSALRSALSTEKDERIYGPFSEQVGWSESIPNPDPLNFRSELQTVLKDGLEQNLSSHDLLKNFEATWAAFFQ